MIVNADMIVEACVPSDLLRRAMGAINGATWTEASSLRGCVGAVIDALLEEGIEEPGDLVRLGSAICARLIAYSALMNSAAAMPWLSRSRAGVDMDEAMIEAMAAAPLLVAHGCYHFDAETFFALALERASPAGSC